MELGKGDKHAEELDARLAKQTPEDPCTLIYTTQFNISQSRLELGSVQLHLERENSLRKLDFSTLSAHYVVTCYHEII